MKMASSSKYKTKVYMILKEQDNMMSDIRGYLQESNLLVRDIDVKSIIVEDIKAMKIVISFERESNLNSLYDFFGKIEKKYQSIEMKMSHE